MKNFIYTSLGIVFSLFATVIMFGNGMDLYEMIDYHLSPGVTNVVRWLINGLGIFLGSVVIYSIIRAFDNSMKE